MILNKGAAANVSGELRDTRRIFPVLTELRKIS
jgi:hypothetical protein